MAPSPTTSSGKGKGKGSSKGATPTTSLVPSSSPSPSNAPSIDIIPFISPFSTFCNFEERGKGGKGKGGKGGKGSSKSSTTTSSEDECIEDDDIGFDIGNDINDCPDGYTILDITGICKPVCITITTNSTGFAELYEFCDSFLHPEDKCCMNNLPSNGGVVDSIVGTATSCVGWKEDIEVTICRGSCVGPNACSNIQFVNGSKIGEFSCRDEENQEDNGQACFEIGIDNDSINEGTLTTIDNCACHGFESCSDTDTDILNIGFGSCRGYEACIRIGQSADIVSVGTNSCVGNGAYFTVDDLDDFTFDDISINEELNVCSDIGLNEVMNVTIGNDSCLGHNSCISIGEESALEVIIGDGTCIGTLACEFIGFFDALNITIGDTACIGPESCSLVGEEDPTTITINDMACSDTVTTFNLNACECVFCGINFDDGDLVIPFGDDPTTSDCDLSNDPGSQFECFENHVEIPFQFDKMIDDLRSSTRDPLLLASSQISF